MENLNLIPKPENSQVSRKLKVLWYSNAIHTGTGYGVQTNNVVGRLANAGLDVRVVANYGLEGAALFFNSILQYPRTNFAEFSEDVLKMACTVWKPDVLVTLFDVWIGKRSRYFSDEDWLSKLHERWIAWVPVDSVPVADAVADQAGKAYRCVAMSKFGQLELKKAGVKSECIPHGVETEVFKPGDKAAARKWLNNHVRPLNVDVPVQLEEGDFVVGVNAANKDPTRKDYERMLVAFSLFLGEHPEARKDAKMCLHTWPNFPGGTDIPGLAHQLGLEKNIKVTFDYYLMTSFTPNQLAKLYNGCDVFMNLARGEGFGVPIIEAEACGVPVIATDYTSMTELVAGHGWLIPPFAADYHGGAKIRNPLLSSWAVPDEYKAAEALADAYLHPEKRRQYAEASRACALNYDFDRVVLPAWTELLNEVRSELGMFGSAAGKDQAFDKLFAQAVAEGGQ